MALYTFRLATGDDGPTVAALYRDAGIPGAPTASGDFERLVQTGNSFLVAEAEGRIDGAVRSWDEEGIGWFEHLVSARPWAGAQLVRAVERGCQDRGIRLLRCRCPDVGIFGDYFGWLGHLPIGRGTDAAGEPELLLERRLPLLTVREQRRADAAAIGKVAGLDPWVFEQGALPGWFVAADGERVVGVVSCADAGHGLAQISPPRLVAGYGGRNLELWMIDRATDYAETNGFHTAEMGAAPGLQGVSKGLEDRYWVREGELWRRVFFTPRAEEDEEW